MKKRITGIMIMLFFIFGMTACGNNPISDATILTDGSSDREESDTLLLQIGEREIEVFWEDNESVEALAELAGNTPLVIPMSRYGGFEQVGPLGSSLPRNDVQINTAAGDIMLYSGNQIVLFYGSNSWAYTRLGKIKNLSVSELEELLNIDNVTITISLQAEEPTKGAN